MSEHEYVVMLTQRCNFRCGYCYQTHRPIDQELEVLARLATHIRRRGGRDSKVVFHGGEPLLRKDLLRAGVQYLLDDEGRPICAFGIVTNGSLIDDDVLELFRRYHFRVSVSFDGCREAQAFRDPSSFDTVVSNLRALVESHEAGLLELVVAITVTLQNLPYLGRSVDFLVELGIPSILIEGDLYGPWVEGTEVEVDRQVERIVQAMERRVEAGLPVPVARLTPRPHDPDGELRESDGELAARRQARLETSECRCGSGSASVIHADGSVWACPLYVPDLGRVAAGRLRDPRAYRYGSWKEEGAPSPEVIASSGDRIRRESLMGPKRERYSIFAECATCPHVADCSVCPGASHLPDVQKPAEEVPPLLCRLSMAFLSRRDRIRRPVRLLDALQAIARRRASGAATTGG